ncbi:MAG: UvrABC system protein A [candidate division WS2 bacterium ADurb.Bin280]|uniref:UvrABC system protein A n=1 Tax=candidate division WS2 bacterium ADurb.Bin280 TaxID=1852829 RepID=A0A1V5SDS3_9BACT|nr:MAG: UvrABC system protein A [candidate division WS2 bacterium ADurb.Bin280]
MENSFIFVKGAREHNLKNVDVKIPRNKLVVMTGLSGSGKSSLAFDTIYAEGQRRYVESLSSYARQFLGQMEKPDVDYIEGLSPAISIDQKAVSKNPRSTVGTVTEIYDYLRVLFARIGKPYCPLDGKKVQQYGIDEIVDLIISDFANQKITIYSPIIRGKKGDYFTLLQDLNKSGYEKAVVDGKILDLKDVGRLERYKSHTIKLLIDEVSVGENEQNKDKISRIYQAVEDASSRAEGLVEVAGDKETLSFSTKFSCPDGHIFDEIEPRLFSFNSPYGACEICGGIGYKLEIDQTLIIPDKSKTIDQGGILPWTYDRNNYYGAIINSLAKQWNVKTNIPIKNLPEDFIEFILFGNGNEDYVPVLYYSSGRPLSFKIKFNGLIDHLESRYNKTDSQIVKEEISKYMSRLKCEGCEGRRLNKKALAVKLNDLTIDKVVAMPIDQCLEFFEKLELNETDFKIGEKLIKEIIARLKFLNDVGLSYLTLDRYANSLSGGETQRIRLASQIGSGLMGVMYVLDEPSIGLHQRDNCRLLNTLKRLRDLGNSVIVIEHDEETMRESDFIVDVGPGAGAKGGEVVACGKINEIIQSPRSITGKYLSGEMKIEVPVSRRKLTGEYIQIKGALEHNLKNLDVKFPLSNLVCVTGVSGSGKSTLVNEILYKGLQREIGKGWEKPGIYKGILGAKQIDKIIDIDQSPIGRTPRSNPATYTKCFDIIRNLFATTQEARIRGYKPGRFSFNVPQSSGGGRCEKCQGDGSLKIEMHFLPDVYIPCDVCKGMRYNRETLEIKYKNKNIAQILDSTVDEASEIFKNIPNLFDKLKVLQDVGLGYIKLGQSATTLSGGEAQRIKLSAELSKRATGHTLYILDEPTTGLHFADVAKLLEVLNRLVDAGNTIVVIEHNLDVIKSADYVIDLGPEGGGKGGKVVAAGSPEMIAGIDSSHTGHFLKKVL